jgi:hypothetical protein
MNEFTAWMQSNWYALGNLLAQFGFLAAGVWFARKIMKTIRASQGPSRWAVARHRAMVWLQTPMSNGEAAPWRRAIKWLQAPARS